MKKYRYLLWDVDGTILDFKAAEKAAVQSLFLRFGLGTCSDEAVARYSEINTKYWQKLERGEMTKPEILVGRFREFFSEIGIDPAVATPFNEAYQPALGDTIVFHDDAFDILKSEKPDYILAAITNGTRTAQEKKLKTSGLRDVFDYIFISELVGAEKPSPAFFDAVFREMGITDKNQVLVIGDSLTSDMKGGCAYGLDTCWYNPAGNKNTGGLNLTYEIRNLHELEDILNR